MPQSQDFSSPELARLVLQQVDAGLLLVHPDSGRIAWLNGQWPALIGWSPEIHEGSLFWDERWWEDAGSVQTAVRLSGLSVPIPLTRLRARSRLGTLVPLHLSCRPLNWAGTRWALCTLSAASLPELDDEPFSTPAESNLMDLVRALSVALESHDPSSRGHQQRVAHLAAAMCRQMGLPDLDTRSIYLAALIHDIGKMAVPQATLTKAEMLTRDEVRAIQGHVLAGVEMIRHIPFPGPVAKLVAQHHERLDGSGYPVGLMAPHIEIGAQIIGVADTVEAMTRDRPYQRARSLQEALSVVREGSAQVFATEVVQACLDLFEHQGYQFPDIGSPGHNGA